MTKLPSLTVSLLTVVAKKCILSIHSHTCPFTGSSGPSSLGGGVFALIGEDSSPVLDSVDVFISTLQQMKIKVPCRRKFYYVRYLCT